MEDNDEIEFDSSSASEANVEDGGNRKQPESPGREVDEEEVFHQVLYLLRNDSISVVINLFEFSSRRKKNRRRIGDLPRNTLTTRPLRITSNTLPRPSLLLPAEAIINRKSSTTLTTVQLKGPPFSNPLPDYLTMLPILLKL